MPQVVLAILVGLHRVPVELISATTAALTNRAGVKTTHGAGRRKEMKEKK